MEGERWGLGNKKGRGHSSGKCDNRECSSWMEKKERGREKMVKGAESRGGGGRRGARGLQKKTKGGCGK